MSKLSKNKLEEQDFFTLEEVSVLLEDEGKNVGKYIQEGYLKIGEDLKVHKDDFVTFLDHLIATSQNKHTITPRRAFIIFWATTVISFVFTAEPNNNSFQPFPSYLITILLLNIVIGIISFILMFLPDRITQKLSKVSILKHIPKLGLLYFITYVVLFSIGGHGLIASQLQTNTTVPIKNETSTASPVFVENLKIPSSVPQAKTAKQAQQPIPSIDPDPIINCNNPNCGPIKIRKSECSDTTGYVCCQIDKKWSWYASRTKCSEDQKNYWSSKYNPPTSSYVPPPNSYTPPAYTETPRSCYIWSASANKSDIFFLTTLECTKKMEEQNKLNEQYLAQQKEYQDQRQQLEQAHKEACTKVVAEWQQYKENFTATEMNNFQSSAEAIMELERRRQVYQQQMRDAGCTQNLYL